MSVEHLCQVLEIVAKIEPNVNLSTKETRKWVSKVLYEISMVELWVSIKKHMCNSAGIVVIIEGAPKWSK